MAAESVDIDLYADDIGEDFNADEFANEGVDLYDDVITTNNKSRRDSEGEPNSGGSDRVGGSSPTNSVNSISKSSLANSDSFSGSNIQPLRKHQVYVGNLTWWTSDRDIMECLREIGVNDFVEVKFYENRSNGQSKGYCVLTVGSDASLRLINEKMSKKELHGQFPVVTPPTKQALNQFESQSKTRPSPTGQQPGGGGGGDNRGGCGGGGPNNMMMGGMGGGPRNDNRGPGPMNQIGGPPMNMGGYGPPPPRMMMGGPPHGQMNRGPRPMGGPPPGHRQMGPPNQQGGPPQQFMPRPMGPHHPQQPPMQQGPRPPMGMDPYFPNHGPHPHGPPGPQHHPQQQPPRGGMPPPGMMDNRGPPPRAEWQPRPGPPIPPQGMLPGPPPPGAPAPHMNPAFFQGGVPPQPYVNNNNPPIINRGVGPGQNYPSEIPREVIPPVMSEIEFEEVMGRNRTVSSSAISRAVSDAATGEFASAIETLVTAISLIKQSKVANDDRCKILVSSLQDTLHGIEAKSYGRRERSRSRERERHRRSRRERSRSRDREYRERSRDRYYEYPRERSRSRERGEYRAPVDRAREEAASGRYYDESRYRERERERGSGGGVVVERERVREPRERDVRDVREREREPEREVVHRPPRH